MRSRFTIILLVIFTIALWGCGSEDTKPNPDVTDSSVLQAQSAVEGLLSALYTVSDHSLYEKLLEDMTNVQPSGVDSGDATAICSFTADIYDDFSALYSPYATEHCIEQLFANREVLNLQQLAYEKGFTSEIDSVSIQPSTMEEVEDTLSLAFDLRIKATYENDGGEDTATVSGYATVEETAPGIFLVEFIRVTDGSQIEKLIEYEPYSFEGESLINIDARSFELKDIPESIAEETVMKDFLYTITAEYDSKYGILADLDPHEISIENEKKFFREGVYTQSYTIHKISTLTEDKFNDDMSYLYYYGWKETVDKHNLSEYKIVNVEYTVALSEKAIALGPQYGEGTFSRNFIVGKTSIDSSYKIYDFAEPLSIDHQ